MRTGDKRSDKRVVRTEGGRAMMRDRRRGHAAIGRVCALLLIVGLALGALLIAGGCGRGDASTDAAIDARRNNTTLDAREDTATTKDLREQSFVAGLVTARFTSQIVVVQGIEGDDARLSLHEHGPDGWQETMHFPCKVGANGIGTAVFEGDCNLSPQGSWKLGFAFGLEPDPGTNMEYRQADDSIYWVDDPESAHYNRWVDTDETPVDWNSAEHIVDHPASYKYCVFIQYNYPDTKPGAGSAFFIHCDSGYPSAGCVTLAEADMIELLQHLDDDAYVIIANGSDVLKY